MERNDDLFREEGGNPEIFHFTHTPFFPTSQPKMLFLGKTEKGRVFFPKKTFSFFKIWTDKRKACQKMPLVRALLFTFSLVDSYMYVRDEEKHKRKGEPQGPSINALFLPFLPTFISCITPLLLPIKYMTTHIETCYFKGSITPVTYAPRSLDTKRDRLIVVRANWRGEYF